MKLSFLTINRSTAMTLVCGIVIPALSNLSADSSGASPSGAET